MVLAAESTNEIPAIEIKTKTDIYEFYKDAILGMSEAYHFAQTKIQLPTLSFPTQAIEVYQKRD